MRSTGNYVGLLKSRERRRSGAGIGMVKVSVGQLSQSRLYNPWSIAPLNSLSQLALSIINSYLIRRFSKQAGSRYTVEVSQHHNNEAFYTACSGQGYCTIIPPRRSA